MSKRFKVAIDAGGGDKPSETAHGALMASANPDVEVIIYGQKEELARIATGVGLTEVLSKVSIVDCSVHSAEMREIGTALSCGWVDAWVTPTNSRLLWGTVRAAGLIEEGLISPALMAPLPTESAAGPGGLGFLMDVGMTLDVRDPKIYLQWAELGSRFLTEQYGISNPRVGLYNIAAERAPDWLRDIDQLLRVNVPRYFGYAEPRATRKGLVDLWLAMGLIGNGLMKTLEEWLELARKRLPASFEAAGDAQTAANIRGVFLRDLCYDAFLISPVIGLKEGKVVCRTHGSATAEQIAGGIISVQRYLGNRAD